jgi:hypothetical protein
MGEGVGQGVGVGRRVILVFFGVWQGKWGGRVFSFFDLFIFWRAALFCVCVCEKGGSPPGVRVVWRCWCEAGVPCVACLW